MRSDTTPAGPRNLPGIWDATRSRITALVADITHGQAGGAVTTVPTATVRDLLAHLAEVASRAAAEPEMLCADAIAPPRPGGAADSVTVTELLAVWEKAAAVARGRVETDDQLASLLITDAVMCEHDLRTTFDTPGARDDVAVKVALDELSGRFSDRVAAAGLPPLRVTVEQWGTIIGAGHAVSCVVADRFEFVRAMAGRRSASEIARWNWGADPAAYLPVISESPLPASEIRERDPRIPEHIRDREFVL